MPLDDMGRTVDRTYDFNTAINDRWKPIDAIGDSQTDYENQAAQRRMDLKQQQDAANRESAAAEGQNDVANSQSGSSSGGGDNKESFINAVSAQESGGNYGARNKLSGAMGKYQIMESNISGKNSGWDKEALGHDITASQFMADPKLQEQVARYKLGKYYEKYGAAGAAIAWYAGPSAANNYLKKGSASTRGEAGGHPSVSGYAQSIMRRMGTGNASANGGTDTKANSTSGGVLNYAKSMQGTPYQWGGNGASGIDCSGLVQQAFSKMGVKMPRTSQEQAKMGTRTSINNLGQGDLVAWSKGGPGEAHHIAIYAGNGMIWEAPRKGVPVRLRKINANEKGIMGINLR